MFKGQPAIIINTIIRSSTFLEMVSFFYIVNMFAVKDRFTFYIPQCLESMQELCRLYITYL